MKSNDEEAICLENCDLTVLSKKIPQISSVEYIFLNNKKINLTVIGENFGNDISKISLHLGNNNCTVTFLNVSLILCNLEKINIGAQQESTEFEYLNLTIKGYLFFC